MSEQGTLDDLKQAIAKVEDYYALPLDLQLRGAVWGASRERDAWRMAFEWHVGLIQRHAALSEEIGSHLADWVAIDREEEEGMALIREKLK